MDSSTSPDLVASTGASDPNGLWYSGLLQTAVKVGTTAATGALNSAVATQTPVKPATVASGPTAAAKDWKSFLPWAIGIALGLGLVVWIVRRF